MRIGHQGLISTHRGSIKARFTCRFLWALKKLNKDKKPLPYFKVKKAAYTSMASAVGPTRTWSRVLLGRIRSRQQSRAGALLRRKNTRREVINKTRVVTNNEDDEAISKLRELVPGGEEMGFCSLLDESAHYIKCLNKMRNIAHLLSV